MRIHSSRFLGLLLALMVAYPWLAETGFGARFFVIATLLIIVGGVLEMQNSRAWQVSALALATPTGLLALRESFVQGEGHAIFFALQAATFALLAANFIVFALRPGAVSGHKISAMISGYLLMGFAFSALYSLLETLQPGSFSSPGTADFDTFDLFYFSFVTLTTTGYGDIVPRSDHARAVALLEAIFGTLYLVVLVSRLVSNLGPRPSARPEADAPGEPS